MDKLEAFVELRRAPGELWNIPSIKIRTAIKVAGTPGNAATATDRNVKAVQVSDDRFPYGPPA